MRLRSLIGLALAALVLRVLAGYWSPVASILDPLLALSIVASFPGRPGLAIAVGVTTGLMEDAWFDTIVGPHAISHTVVAYLLALVAARVDLTQPLPASLALALGTVADWGLRLLLGLSFGRSPGIPPSLGYWLGAALATTLLGLTIRRFASRFESFD